MQQKNIYNNQVAMTLTLKCENSSSLMQQQITEWAISYLYEWALLNFLVQKIYESVMNLFVS